MSCFKKSADCQKNGSMGGMGLYLHLSVSFFPHCGIGSVLPEDGAHPVPVSSRYRVEMAYMF